MQALSDRQPQEIKQPSVEYAVDLTKESSRYPLLAKVGHFFREFLYPLEYLLFFLTHLADFSGLQKKHLDQYVDLETDRYSYSPRGIFHDNIVYIPLGSTELETANIKAEQKISRLTEAANQLAPRSLKPRYTLLLAKEHYAQGNLEEALATLHKTPEKKRSAGSYFLEGQILAKREDLAKAYDSFQLALEKNPSEFTLPALDAQNKIISLLQDKSEKSLHEQYSLAFHEARSRTDSTTACEDFFRTITLKELRSFPTRNFSLILSHVCQKPIEDLSVQATIGHCFYFVIGTDQNYLKAKNWYQNPAEQEIDAEILWCMSLCCEYTGGNTRHWAEKAAEQDNAEAQCYLGNYYHMHDNTVAISWFEKAAEQGNVEAMRKLGNLCSRQGDNKKAEQWFLKVAKMGDLSAQRWLVDYYKQDIVKVKETVVRPKDLTQATFWAQQAIAQSKGRDRARKEELGNLFLAQTNYIEAARWYYQILPTSFDIFCGDHRIPNLLDRCYRAFHGISTLKVRRAALNWAASLGEPTPLSPS